MGGVRWIGFRALSWISCLSFVAAGQRRQALERRIGFAGLNQVVGREDVAAENELQPLANLLNGWLDVHVLSATQSILVGNVRDDVDYAGLCDLSISSAWIAGQSSALATGTAKRTPNQFFAALTWCERSAI